MNCNRIVIVPEGSTSSLHLIEVLRAMKPPCEAILIVEDALPDAEESLLSEAIRSYHHADIPVIPKLEKDWELPRRKNNYKQKRRGKR